MADDRDRSSELYVDPDLFMRGLDATRELLAAGTLRLLVGTAVRQFQFELTEEGSEELLTKCGLSLDDLRRVFFDIEDVLLAATRNVDVDRFARVRSDPERWEDRETEEAAVAIRKFNAVHDVFDVQELVRRIWLKANAKTAVPKRIDWEVAQKLGDEDTRPPGEDGRPVVFGVLRIGSEPADFRNPFREGTEIVVTVDEEDVAYMRDALNRLHRAMRNAHNGERHD